MNPNEQMRVRLVQENRQLTRSLFAQQREIERLEQKVQDRERQLKYYREKYGLPIYTKATSRAG